MSAEDEARAKYDAALDEGLRLFVGWPFVIARPERLGVAVSGGGDSMALLDLLRHWAEDQGVPLEVVTVDHGLRAEAKDEIALAAEYCAAQGIPHSVLEWHWDGRGNLQARAREARYGLMADWARARGVDVIALGHTRDDQAETFLMRLARESGSDGLRGMDTRFERNGITWARPVLSQSREELREYLHRQGIPWAEDASNTDAGFERVRARQVLAALEPLGIDANTLTGVAHNLAMENGIVRCAVAEWTKGTVTDEAGALRVARRDLRLQYPEVQRRLVLAILGWLTGPGYPPRRLALADFIFAITGGQTATLSGVICFTRKDTVWFAREYNAVKDLTSENGLWDGRWRMTGAAEAGLTIRAIGPDGLRQLPDWRDTGLPRRVLMVTPSVWRGDALISAPMAGLSGGWRAETTRGPFAVSS